MERSREKDRKKADLTFTKEKDWGEEEDWGTEIDREKDQSSKNEWGKSHEAETDRAISAKNGDRVVTENLHSENWNRERFSDHKRDSWNNPWCSPQYQLS